MKSAVLENAAVPAAPPVADHWPLAEVPLCITVMVTASVTVAPPLRNVHVPVHPPARFNGVGEGFPGEPPQAASASPHAIITAQPVFIG